MDKKIDQWIQKELKQTVQNIEPSSQLYFKIKSQINLQEAKSMKKGLFTSKKAKSVVLVAALCVMSLTCYGAMKIVGYESHSFLEFSSFPTVTQVEKKVNFSPKFVEKFTNGFVFDSASVGTISGIDDEWNAATKEYKQISFGYKKDGKYIGVTNREVTEEIESNYETMEQVDIDGITAYYSSDQYKFFPPDEKPSEEDLQLEREGKLFISYGSAEITQETIQNLFWEEDGIVYEMTALDVNMNQNELLQMAKEIIQQ